MFRHALPAFLRYNTAIYVQNSAFSQKGSY